MAYTSYSLPSSQKEALLQNDQYNDSQFQYLQYQQQQQQQQSYNNISSSSNYGYSQVPSSSSKSKYHHNNQPEKKSSSKYKYGTTSSRSAAAAKVNSYRPVSGISIGNRFDNDYDNNSAACYLTTAESSSARRSVLKPSKRGRTPPVITV